MSERTDRRAVRRPTASRTPARRGRVARLVPVVAASGLCLVLGACSAKPRTATNSPNAGPTVKAPTAPGGAPLARVANTPECKALNAFGFASLLSILPPEKQAAALETAIKAGDDVKAVLPDVADEIDSQLDAMRALVNGTASPGPGSNTKIDAYWKANCVT